MTMTGIQMHLIVGHRFWGGWLGLKSLVRFPWFVIFENPQSPLIFTLTSVVSSIYLKTGLANTEISLFTAYIKVIRRQEKISNLSILT